jgi:hypothetical protein
MNKIPSKKIQSAYEKLDDIIGESERYVEKWLSY